MEIKRYQTLALDIFQTLNVLNPTYMQDLFYLRSSSAIRPNNIAIVRTNMKCKTSMERKTLDHRDLTFIRTHKGRNSTGIFEV